MLTQVLSTHFLTIYTFNHPETYITIIYKWKKDIKCKNPLTVKKNILVRRDKNRLEKFINIYSCFISGFVPIESASCDIMFCDESSIPVLLLCTSGVVLVYCYICNHGYPSQTVRKTCRRYVMLQQQGLIQKYY